MKRLIAAAGLALAAASTAACAGTHTSSPATVTVTTTPAQSVAPVTPVTPVMPPTDEHQWVNAGQLDFYVYSACQPQPPPDEVRVMMYVKNTSGVPQTYTADAQMLMDDQGRLFAPTPGTTVSSTSPPQGDQFDLDANVNCPDGSHMPNAATTHLAWDANGLTGTARFTYKYSACGNAAGFTFTNTIQFRRSIH